MPGQVQPGADAARVDRVLAVVNGEPITYSEVLEAIALMPGVTPAPTLDEALERLIDARLMEHEARRYLQEPPSEEESEATLRALMDRFATPEDYRATLRRLGVAEDYLRKRIQRELIVDRYVDRRFRPLVQVAQREVEEYYRTVLLPDLDAGSPATLVEVESLIRNILEQRDLNRRISAWVDELKSSASIVRLPLSEPPSVGLPVRRKRRAESFGPAGAIRGPFRGEGNPWFGCGVTPLPMGEEECSHLVREVTRKFRSETERSEQ